jgi:hypothetical protein
MLVRFKDEYDAESWAWLFVPMGYRQCCAGAYYNAWIKE